MSGIPLAKSKMPKSLGINEKLERYEKVGSNCQNAYTDAMRTAGVSERVSLARQTLPLRLAISIAEREPFCFIWKVEEYPMTLRFSSKENMKKVDARYLKGDSRIFYRLCSKEKINDNRRLPIILLANTISTTIWITIDMFKYKKIRGIEI